MKRVVLACALAVSSVSSGCLGTGALNGEVKEFNLGVVENRWAREGLFLGLQVLWVYRICTVLDLFIFNSIEFWSGSNFINGENALVDLPPSMAEKIALEGVERAQVARTSEEAAKLYVDFRNGDHLSFDVLRQGDEYTVSYLGRVFFTGRIEPVESERGL